MKDSKFYLIESTLKLFIWISAGACGAMDNASDYGSEDSRFESWQARKPVLRNIYDC